MFLFVIGDAALLDAAKKGNLTRVCFRFYCPCLVYCRFIYYTDLQDLKETLIYSLQVMKLSTPENINCRDTQGRNSTPLHLAGE